MDTGSWIFFNNQWSTIFQNQTNVKEIYVIFIHLFDSGILLIIDLNKKKGKKGGGWISFVNFTVK
jgi:hypothetical protein